MNKITISNYLNVFYFIHWVLKQEKGVLRVLDNNCRWLNYVKYRMTKKHPRNGVGIVTRIGEDNARNYRFFHGEFADYEMKRMYLDIYRHGRYVIRSQTICRPCRSNSRLWVLCNSQSSPLNPQLKKGPIQMYIVDVPHILHHIIQCLRPILPVMRLT